MSRIQDIDSELYEIIGREQQRECDSLRMIASENYCPEEILEAQSSSTTNKYAEGYPRRRYYEGCYIIDEIEQLAIDRAKSLFAAEHANVQPHSGTNANLAVYFAMLEPGDTLLAMDLSQGGHLSHGSPVSITGKLYNFVHYGVCSQTEYIDMDQVRQLAHKHQPKMIVAGATAYPRAIDFREFRQVADEVGALLMIDMAHFAGLVAGGAHDNPAKYADFVTSTTHKTLRGGRGGLILCKDEYRKAINRAVFPGTQGGPILPMVVSKALCFKLASTDEFKEYAHQTVANARAFAELMQESGYRVCSGGTDTHLILVDLSGQGITGKDAAAALDRAGITANKNLVPFDKTKAMVTSGLRFGTAALTVRGFKEAQIEQVCHLIHKVLSNLGSENVEQEVRGEVTSLCREYPIYEQLVGSQTG